MDSRKQQEYDNGVIYMDNKKKFAAICIGVLILAASVGTTLAYLGAIDNKDNKIKVGTDIAQVSETFTEPEIQKQENTTQKEVQVKNTGTVPCFVRVYAEFSDSYIASIAKVANKDAPEENDYSAWETFKNTLAGETNTIAADWKYIKEGTDDVADNLEGYFYYTKILPLDNSDTTDVDESVTSSLIKKVKVTYPNENTEDYIRDYEMIVYTETVQAVDTNGKEFAAADWQTVWDRFLNKTEPTT